MLARNRRPRAGAVARDDPQVHEPWLSSPDRYDRQLRAEARDHPRAKNSVPCSSKPHLFNHRCRPATASLARRPQCHLTAFNTLTRWIGNTDIILVNDFVTTARTPCRVRSRTGKLTVKNPHLARCATDLARCERGGRLARRNTAEDNERKDQDPAVWRSQHMPHQLIMYCSSCSIVCCWSEIIARTTSPMEITPITLFSDSTGK